MEEETITCLICFTLCCLDVGELMRMIGLREETGMGCGWVCRASVYVCVVCAMWR